MNHYNNDRCDARLMRPIIVTNFTLLSLKKSKKPIFDTRKNTNVKSDTAVTALPDLIRIH